MNSRGSRDIGSHNLFDGGERSLSQATPLAFQVKRPSFEDVELEDGWYRGKVNSRGLRHGQGIMYYLNGDRYQGKWSLGRR